MASSLRAGARTGRALFRPTAPASHPQHQLRRGFASTCTRLSEPVPDVGISFLQPFVPVLTSISDTLGCSHAVSIFITAFAVRTAVTLPVNIWQRRRTLRMTENVLPQWNVYKQRAPNAVRARCRRAGLSYEAFQKELQTDLKNKLASLLKQHRCSPLPTFIAPLAVHLPVFFLMSAIIRQATISPGSPFLTELLPWWSPSPELAEQIKATTAILTDRGVDPEAIARLQGTQGGPTLADRDKTMIGPVGLGMLTLTNVELTSWSRRTLTSVESQPEREKDAPEEEPRRNRIITNALRVLAIGFIPIASQAPGALVIYWLSSGVYTLTQNSIFAILDRRREAAKTLRLKQK